MNQGCVLGFLRVKSVTFGFAGRRDRRCMRSDARLRSRIVAFALCCCLAEAFLLCSSPLTASTKSG